MNKDDFIRLCKRAGLSIVLRQDSSLWELVYGRVPYQSTLYLSSMIDYQLEYQQGHGGYWEDFSCVIFSDKKPVALWPITFSLKDEVVNLSSQGRELLPPIFVDDCPNKTKKSVIRSAVNLIDVISDEISLQIVTTVSVFDGSQGLDNWHALWMKSGAESLVQHNLYVDLSYQIEKIKSFLRRRYKSFVSTGERIWNVEVLSGFIERNVWEEFRHLHLEVAQRVTRSEGSWELQYLSVKTGESFLIVLRDDEGKMVGAGLFTASRDEGCYAVGAYDRGLFDKPLSHVVQFRAIQEMQKRGCLWYFIGRRSYPSDEPTPSEKELSISNFKEGFSTHLVPSIQAMKKYTKNGTI